MCECPCVLRPFFGQCIFNIIFAASAYPLQLFSPISLPPLPSSLSCRGRNFFGFFIFGCFLSILLIPILPAHWQQPCLQWACMYFFHIRHGRVLGVGRRPLATVRFAGGLAAYAKCSQRFCIYIFLFLHLPLSPTYSSTAFFCCIQAGCGG